MVLVVISDLSLYIPTGQTYPARLEPADLDRFQTFSLAQFAQPTGLFLIT